MKEDRVDLEKLKLVDSFITEKELSERLSISQKDKTINLTLFANLLKHPVGREEFHKYDGFYLAFEVLRESLGFKKGLKPGDFDIIIIPYNKSKIFFERTCAIEVKIVRPTRKKPRKSPNSYGVSQVEGLIRDGFPLVGLIHICMTEPLMEDEKSTMKFYPEEEMKILNMDSLLKNSIDIKFDHFSQFSAENQMKKLVSMFIPKFVGLNTVGVNLTSENKLMTCFNHDFNNKFSSSYFNPNLSKLTIEKVKKYYLDNPNEFKNALI